MKKIFYFVAASLLMTSCLEDKAIEEYNEDFVSVFGETDPLHTWKMVENQSVEVNLDKSSRVKIYVKVGNEYRLAADYENVSGTQSLTYDAPAGCEDIHVTVDGVPFYGVKSRNESTESPIVAITETGDYKYFTYGDIYNYYFTGNALPEDIDNRGKLDGLNYKVIKSDVQSYLFYPVYWGAEYYHSYGLYYYDAKGIKQEVPFIGDFKTGGLIQRIKDVKEDWKNDNNWIDVHPDYAYEHFLSGTSSYDAKDIVLRSKCYEITLPKDTQFGFYVDIKNQQKNPIGLFYSDPKLNDATKPNSNFSAFAYLIKDNITYITVEDSEDTDYNDFVFVLEGIASPVKEDPTQYIYAVEDLGGTNDFDFNDVVFSVSYVAGQENATVQPLAAGGIYETQILFNGKSCGKIHADMFGVDRNVMVNTAEGTNKDNMIKADPFLVNVGTKWSNTATSYGNSGNGFSVIVTIPNKPDKDITTFNPGDHSAPQMLVLSENWLWPTEKTRISDAYPEFERWGQNYSITNWDRYYDANKKTWISKHTDGKVVNWK